MMQREVREAILGCEAGAAPGEVTAVLRFPATAAVFEGHFPGHPLVPGIHLIEAVRLAMERHLGRACGLQSIRQARFLREVAPGKVVTVCIATRMEGTGMLARARLLVDGEAAANVDLILDIPGAESPAG